MTFIKFLNVFFFLVFFSFFSCTKSTLIYQNNSELSEEEQEKKIDNYVANDFGEFPSDIDKKKFFNNDYQITRLGLISLTTKVDDENLEIGHFLNFFAHHLSSELDSIFINNGFYLVPLKEFAKHPLLPFLGDDPLKPSTKNTLGLADHSRKILVNEESKIIKNIEWVKGITENNSLNAALIFDHTLNISAGGGGFHINKIELIATLILPFQTVFDRAKLFGKESLFYQGECNSIEKILININRKPCSQHSDLPRKKNVFFKWKINFDANLFIPEQLTKEVMSLKNKSLNKEIELFKETYYTLALHYLLLKMRKDLPYHKF